MHPDQIVTMLAHILRMPTVALPAYSFLEDRHWAEQEEVPKILYAIARDHQKLAGCSPNLAGIRLELSKRKADSVDQFPDEVWEHAKQMAETIWADQDLDPYHGLKLVQEFVYDRDFKPKVADLAKSFALDDSKFEETERCYKKVIGIVSNISPADCSAASIIKSAEFSKPVRFLKTGYVSIDNALNGGLALREMTTLAAPTGMGKTTLCLNFALHVLDNGQGVLIISLEMRAVDLIKLAMGILCQVPRWKMRNLKLTDEEVLRFIEATKTLSGMPLYVVDRAGLGQSIARSSTVESFIRQAVEQNAINLVIIDYLSKLDLDTKEDELRRMARLNAWAYGLAQELDVHIIAISQFNKANFGSQKNSPGLQGVRGGIESVADPDNVIILTREDWNTPEQIDPAPSKAIVQKARNGPGGVAHLLFSRSIGKFEAYVPKDEPPAMLDE